MASLEPLPIVLPDAMPDTGDAALIAAASDFARPFEARDGAERIPELVTSCGVIAWKFFEAVTPYIHKPHPTFCEWGSGVGLVTCLAKRRGWQAIGLELQPRLVTAARRLATSQKIDTQFFEGSYKPDALFEDTAGPGAFDTGHGFGLFDFDIIYAFPWPAETERLTAGIARHAKDGTLVLRYGGGIRCDAFRVVR